MSSIIDELDVSPRLDVEANCRILIYRRGRTLLRVEVQYKAPVAAQEDTVSCHSVQNYETIVKEVVRGYVLGVEIDDPASGVINRSYNK